MNVFKRDWREKKLSSWAFGGLWVFVTAFLWSPSRDGVEAVYVLTFFIPMLLLLLWRKPELHQYGGWFSVSALAVDSRSLFWEIDTKWLRYWVPAALLVASLMSENKLRVKKPRIKH